MTKLAPLMSSEVHTWQTPDVVLDLVRKVAPIALDPCTSADNPTRALRFFTEADDGLAKDWGREMFEERGDDGACLEDHGLIYVNGPYGRALSKWTAKILDEAKASTAMEMIALTPARTDARWFQNHIAKADALCFWKGRMTFKGAPAPAPFPSLLAYFGPHPSSFRKVFSEKGWIP